MNFLLWARELPVYKIIFLTKENEVAIMLSVNKAGHNFVLTYGVSSVMGQYNGVFNIVKGM